MKKIIYLVFAYFAFAFTSNAQVISMIGDGVSGWGIDVNMTTSDNVHYTLTGFTFSNGGAKFRQDANWTNNWGSSAFPSGTATPGGSNIPTVAGVYDVTFNLTTKAYAFTAVAMGFPDISVYGTSNSNVDGVMSTTDGVTYKLYNYNVGLGNLVFRQDLMNTNTWASANFPTGTATSGGTPMSVIPGTYNISFNLTTGVYSFTFAKISIIGDGLAGWGTDTDMDTNDGINYIMNLTAFNTGQIKFRQDNSWAFNWGGNTFPNGTSTLNGNNINTIAGNYVVSFNRVTGVYSFSSTFPVISLYNGSTDIDMITIDGENYFLNNYNYTTGLYKFRQAHANAFVWGSSAFPNGTAATYLTSSILVPGKSYNVTFNKNTGIYRFTFVTISIIGDATPGGWGADTNMSTTNGINYNLNGVTLTNAFLKFRQGNDWAINWGGTTFPAGTGTQGGNNIAVNDNSVYNISFNRETGEYLFTDVVKTKVQASQCGTTLPLLNTDIRADFVRSITNYRFKVVANGITDLIETNIRSFQLTSLPNGAVYNTAYTISVATKLNGTWYNYGAECVVTTPPVPVTKVRALQCGITLPMLNTDILADWLQFATDYRFKVVANGTTEIIETNVRTFKLTALAAGAIFNTAYTISVAVKQSGVWGVYGAECIVTTPIVPVTKVRAAQCGITLAALNTDILADLLQFATDYRFKVVANGTTETIETNVRTFKLTALAAGSVFNTAYTISVAVKQNGVWGVYGAECVVTTPMTPVTKVQNAQCGATLAALYTDILADWLQFATDYRFKVVANGVTRTIETNNRTFKLTALTGGAMNNTAYTISVAVKQNGVWGNYGAECIVNTPTNAATSRQMAETTSLETINFSLVAYPNPSNSTFKIQVNGADDKSISILVFDMMGRQIENKVVNANDIENISIGQNYSTGIYNVIVSQGMNTKTVRLVKN